MVRRETRRLEAPQRWTTTLPPERVAEAVRDVAEATGPMRVLGGFLGVFRLGVDDVQGASVLLSYRRYERSGTDERQVAWRAEVSTAPAADGTSNVVTLQLLDHLIMNGVIENKRQFVALRDSIGDALGGLDPTASALTDVSD